MWVYVCVRIISDERRGGAGGKDKKHKKREEKSLLLSLKSNALSSAYELILYT